MCCCHCSPLFSERPSKVEAPLSFWCTLERACNNQRAPHMPPKKIAGPPPKHEELLPPNLAHEANSHNMQPQDVGTTQCAASCACLQQSNQKPIWAISKHALLAHVKEKVGSCHDRLFASKHVTRERLSQERVVMQVCSNKLPSNLVLVYLHICGRHCWPYG